MLTQIKLKNFKIFKEETSFPLAKINLLTGINGGGKSSLLQALLLMRQSIEQDENTSQIYLNGSCVRLGSFEDVSNVDSVEDTIGIGFSLLNLEKELSIDLDYSFIENPANHSAIDLKNLKISSSHLFYNRQSPEKTTKSIEIYQNQASSEIPYSEKWLDTDLEITNNKNLNGLHRFFYLYIKIEENQFLADTFFKKFNEIHYVSADRIGPKDFYLKENLGKFINVGAKGEMTANVLSYKKGDKDDLVSDHLYLGEDAKTLIQQTEEWLREIFGKAKIKVEDKDDIIYLYFNTKDDGNWYKPSNVGFGFSYILPIIVSGLIAKEGEILIVENPEAHLHPKAQSKLTQFLAKVASGGVQVFIESHSEHILNGLRITSINQDININNEDISILYFHEKEDGYFTKIPIKPNGKIDKWPDGFFDQTENDLDIILGI